MVVFKTCVIALSNQVAVYRQGELVRGQLILEILQPATVKAVRVYCIGQALTKWTKDFSRTFDSDNIGQENYYNTVFTCCGNKVNQNGLNVNLDPGHQRWNFAFRLPKSNLPSSYEGPYGAVRWWLKAEVVKPFPSFNNSWYRAITVLSNLDLNLPVYNIPVKKTGHKIVSKTLGLGNAGSVSLNVETDRFGYCPGESAVIKVEASNNSNKDLGKISTALLQVTIFKANSETKNTNIAVAVMQTEVALLKGTTMTLNNLQLRIPAVPPSTQSRTCHIITVTYRIRVTVHVPWGFNLDVDIPIAIGTIPRGMRVPSPNRQPGAAVDAATAIQYVPCQLGITPCSKSYGNFPNFPYTPLCPIVSGSVANPTCVGASALAATAPQLLEKQQLSEKPPLDDMKGNPKLSDVESCHPNSDPPPPSYDETQSPPSYEEILQMDEEAQRGSGSFEEDPVGTPCGVLLIRFPDATLAEFRQFIRREHSGLVDNSASLVALAAQPYADLSEERDLWPSRTSVAIFVFPNCDAGKLWWESVGCRGESWQKDCDALMIPGNWTAPEGEHTVFTLTLVKVKEGVTLKSIQNYRKNIAPKFVQLRRECKGLRIVLSNKWSALTGSWVSPRESLTLAQWPHADNYFQYRGRARTGDLVSLHGETRQLFKNCTVLIASEDVTSLTTQSANTQQPESDNQAAENSTVWYDDSRADEDIEETGENLLVNQQQNRE